MFFPAYFNYNIKNNSVKLQVFFTLVLEKAGIKVHRSPTPTYNHH